MSQSSTFTIVVSARETAVALSVSSTSIRAGESVTFYMGLFIKDTDTPIPGKYLSLVVGDTTHSGLGPTDSNGRVETTITFDAVGSYDCYAIFGGDSEYEGCAESLRL